MTDLLVPPSDAPLTPLASEQEAREVAEAAREKEWEAPSFVREMFEGSFRLDLVHPFPAPDPADLERARPFMERLERFMRERVDSDTIDREGKIPSYLVKALGDLGAFGIKIPTEYGGLGLSQYSYTRAIGLVTSQDGNLTALLSAAQSIGVPTPLKLFGTPEQKKRYLPRLAQGAVSAFALTENNVGSDPAALGTTATLSEDGSHYVLNGEKLWCTNGTIAELMVVMARTGPKKITAFIVEADWPGVRGGAAAALHGAEGDRERHHPLHQRPGAGGERALGRGQGAQARAHHPQHRTAHAAGVGSGRREARAGVRPALGGGAGAVGRSRSASTTPSPRSSAGWRRRSSPWRRSPISRRCWPTGATPTSGSRPRWPRCGTPRSAGGSWTTRCRSRAAAVTRPRTASGAGASVRSRSSG